MKRGWNAATFAVYLLISVAFFSPPLWNHFSTRRIGVGADPTIYIWFFKWWPYAIWHHLNPLFTREIFAPTGINVTWTTCLPLAAILASPITELWGPVPAYNLVCLISPPLAAWAAFQLCRYLTHRYWPAFFGGYIFGFSTYMLTQLRGHLVETLIFPIPLIILVVLRRLHDEISPGKFIASMVALLLTQFLLSIEQVATLTFLGGIAIVVACLVYEAQTRRRIISIIPQLAMSYALMLLLLMPYEYCMFAYGFPHGPVWAGSLFQSDLVNFVVPTHVSLVGTFSWFMSRSRNFAANVFEDSAFVGWPLIGIALSFGISQWRLPSTRMLIICLSIICIFSMGEVLLISGTKTIWLPWKLVLKLPLISSALPCRLTLFVFLILAVITALFVSRAANHFAVMLVALLAALCLLPDFKGDWASSAETPAFFSNNIYRAYVKPGQIVWLLPPEDYGDSMLWQANTNMYFRMAEGYAGPEQDWSGERRPKWSRRQSDQLEYLAYGRVTAVIMSPWVWQYYRTDGPLEPRLKFESDFEESVANMLSALGLTAQEVGDVKFYSVPHEILVPFMLPHREIEKRLTDSLVSRVDKTLSYVAYCIPKSQPPSEIDAREWSAIDGAADAPSGDPYSRDFQVSVGLGPNDDMVFLVTAADIKYLDRLQSVLLAASIQPEAMSITPISDSWQLALSLTKGQVLKIAPPNGSSICGQ